MDNWMKELDALKFAENGIKVSKWFGDKIGYKFVHGAYYLFDLGLCSTSLHAQFKRHGVEARLGDKCAVNIKEFPDRIARSQEAARRLAEVGDHYKSGTDAWELPREGRGPSGPNEADLREIIGRIFPGRDSNQIFNDLLTKKHGGDLAKVREAVLANGDGAKAWVAIQNERRAARVEALTAKADDLLAGLE